MYVRTKPYIYEFGGSGELIILLHGFLSSKEYWSKLAPQLVTEGYRVIAIDLLGFGGAPKPVFAEYSYEDHIDHINRVLRDLKIDEPYTLIGHSMGALIAERIALENEKSIKQLILLHPPLYKNPSEARAVLRETGHLYRFLLDSKYRNTAWPMIRFFFFGKMKHHKWSREKSLTNVIEKAEAFKDLVNMRKRTLLVVGTLDRPEYIENLNAATVSDVVTVLYEDVAHHSPIRQPLLITHAILPFMVSA